MEQVVLSRRSSSTWSAAHPPGPGQDPVRKEKSGLKRISEVKMEPIDWFWYPYIPRGKLTILGGDPGQGKSFITAAIAASLSQGNPLPGQEYDDRDPMTTLMFVGEDDLGDTIKPRLMSLGADQRLVFAYDENLVLDSRGLAKIDALIEETQADFITIDPIVAYLGAKLDMNRSNEVRPVLKALADLAKKHNVAIVLVRHMRKQPAGAKGGKAIYSGMGSIDFTAAVRSELQVEEAANGQKYLNHVKSNVGPKGKAIRYSIEDDKFSWGEQVDAVQFIKETAKVSKKFKNETVARLWLFDLLRDAPDGLPSADIFLRAKAQGISDTKLKSVKTGLVITEKVGNHWQWRLDPSAQRIEGAEA
jgi:nicotinamidase-related amidase